MAIRYGSVARLGAQAVLVAGLVLIGTNLAPPPSALELPHGNDFAAAVTTTPHQDGGSRSTREAALLARVAALEARLTGSATLTAVASAAANDRAMVSESPPPPPPALGSPDVLAAAARASISPPAMQAAAGSQVPRTEADVRENARQLSTACGTTYFDDFPTPNVVLRAVSRDECPDLQAAVQGASRAASDFRGKFGLAVRAAPLQVPGCTLRWYTPSEACDLLERAGKLILLGDSLVRAVAFGLVKVLTNDYKYGGVWRPEDGNREHCACDNLFGRDAACHFPPNVRYGNNDVRYTSLPQDTCPLWRKQHLHFVPSAGPEFAGARLQEVLDTEPELRSTVYGASGLNFGADFADHARVQREWFDPFLRFAATSSGRARYICASNPAGDEMRKGEPWKHLQRDEVVRGHNNMVRQACGAAGIEFFDAYALTRNAWSHDGVHYQTTENVVMAQVLLNFLDRNDARALTSTSTPTISAPLVKPAGPFRRVVLLLMFNGADYLGNLLSLERWYAPHFDRIVIYCDIPGSETADQAAAAALARGTPAQVVSRVTFVHSGVGLAYSGGVTRSDIAGGSFSQVALAHYYSRLADSGELTRIDNQQGKFEGVFFLCDDALLSPRLLRDLSATLPLVGFAYEAGRLYGEVGRGRDSSWSWWRMGEGRPRMQAVMEDPAMREFAPAGETARLEWVGGYSDYVYVPRRFLEDGRLQRCLALLASHAVFNEIAIPTCAHLCVQPVPEATLVYQPHGRTVLWGDERKVMNMAFIEQALQTSLIVHPVKLGRLSAADRARLDTVMMPAL